MTPLYCVRVYTQWVDPCVTLRDSISGQTHYFYSGDTPSIPESPWLEEAVKHFQEKEVPRALELTRQVADIRKAMRASLERYIGTAYDD